MTPPAKQQFLICLDERNRCRSTLMPPLCKGGAGGIGQQVPKRRYNPKRIRTIQFYEFA